MDEIPKFLRIIENDLRDDKNYFLKNDSVIMWYGNSSINIWNIMTQKTIDLIVKYGGSTNSIVFCPKDGPYYDTKVDLSKTEVTKIKTKTSLKEWIIPTTCAKLHSNILFDPWENCNIKSLKMHCFDNTADLSKWTSISKLNFLGSHKQYTKIKLPCNLVKLTTTLDQIWCDIPESKTVEVLKICTSNIKWIKFWFDYKEKIAIKNLPALKTIVICAYDSKKIPEGNTFKFHHLKKDGDKCKFYFK